LIIALLQFVLNNPNYNFHAPPTHLLFHPFGVIGYTAAISVKASEAYAAAWFPSTVFMLLVLN
jgi:hypothetical protein